MRKVHSADPGPCGDVAVYPPFRKSASDDFKRLGVAVTFYPGGANGCRNVRGCDNRQTALNITHWLSGLLD